MKEGLFSYLGSFFCSPNKSEEDKASLKEKEAMIRHSLQEAQAIFDRADGLLWYCIRGDIFKIRHHKFHIQKQQAILQKLLVDISEEKAAKNDTLLENAFNELSKRMANAFILKCIVEDRCVIGNRLLFRAYKIMAENGVNPDEGISKIIGSWRIARNSKELEWRVTDGMIDAFARCNKLIKEGKMPSDEDIPKFNLTPAAEPNLVEAIPSLLITDEGDPEAKAIVENVLQRIYDCMKAQTKDMEVTYYRRENIDQAQERMVKKLLENASSVLKELLEKLQAERQAALEEEFTSDSDTGTDEDSSSLEDDLSSEGASPQTTDDEHTIAQTWEQG
jgi:hypothetical protein